LNVYHFSRSSPLRAGFGLKRFSRAAFFVLVSGAQGQTTTGQITGRVFIRRPRNNVAQRRGAHRAHVRKSLISEGRWLLPVRRVPAGDAVLVTSYTGHESARAKVAVRPGAGGGARILGNVPDDSLREGAIACICQAIVISSEREGAGQKLSQSRKTR